MAISKSVLNSIREIVEHEQGMRTNVQVSAVVIDDDVDVRAIRKKLELSQQKFSDLYGVPLSTIRNWESGRRKPEKAARLLLKVILREPAVVASAIR